jgi:hypothetical protein
VAIDCPPFLRTIQLNPVFSNPCHERALIAGMWQLRVKLMREVGQLPKWVSGIWVRWTLIHERGIQQECYAVLNQVPTGD